MTDLNVQVEAAARQRADEQDRIKRFEAAAADCTLALDVGREIESALQGASPALVFAKAHEQQLPDQALDVTNLLAAEQNRGSDFNSRLDDLERSPPSSSKR